MTHIKGRFLAKTVMVNVDGAMAMAVLPSQYHVDFVQLAKGIGAYMLELAGGAEFKERFPGL